MTEGMLLNVCCACCSIVSEFRDDLESYIFDRGAEGLKTHLCLELTAACSAHQLSDAMGEL